MDYAKILIVDDEPANVLLLQRVLARADYARIRSTNDPRDVEALLTDFDPDIILLDLHMPEMDGFAVLAQLRRIVSAANFLPIIVLTADVTQQTKLRALSSGAHDFLTKPFDNAEVVQRVGNLLKARRLHLQLEAQRENLEHVVAERTVELQKTLEQLKTTQQQIIQQERLHAFGTMAGGVAHDFNNALSVILGFSEIALNQIEEDGGNREVAQHLRTIMTAALDGAAMVNRLREFYRPGGRDEPRIAVDVNALVEQAASITRPKWSAQSLGNGIAIEVTTDLHDVPTIAGDPAELREALTNLIFNAVDAMPDGGAVTLRTRAEADGVRLEVNDTGVGMPDPVRRRCLEPFFTTKGERGTGLGLAMVYGTIERHGGTLEIESEPGAGTTFRICLPKHIAASQLDEPAEQHAVDPLQILVVDDQPVLCEILAAYLTDDAHTVVTAGNGEEALEKLCAGAFDLVITDHVMPGISGRELAAAVKDHSPETVVFLLTGFADPDGQLDHGFAADSAVDHVLAKPLSQIELRKAITRASGRRLVTQR